MSILQAYQEKKSQIYKRIAAHTIQPQEALAMQELNYRVCVLETFQAFIKSAPMSMDPKRLGFHYQVVDHYIKFTLTERQFGLPVDEAGQKKRDTALDSFQKVVQDGRKRFVSCKLSKPEQYSEMVSKHINALLPMWLAYRDTYVKLGNGEERKS